MGSIGAENTPDPVLFTPLGNLMQEIIGNLQDDALDFYQRETHFFKGNNNQGLFFSQHPIIDRHIITSLY